MAQPMPTPSSETSEDTQIMLPMACGHHSKTLEYSMGSFGSPQCGQYLSPGPGLPICLVRIGNPDLLVMQVTHHCHWPQYHFFPRPPISGANLTHYPGKDQRPAFKFLEPGSIWPQVKPCGPPGDLKPLWDSLTAIIIELLLLYAL